MGEIRKVSRGSVIHRGGHRRRWELAGGSFIGVVVVDATYFHLVHHVFGAVSPLISLVIVLAGLGMIIWGAVTRR